MKVLREMRLIWHLQEVLTGNTHPTINELPLIEDMEQMDHLMETLVIMVLLLTVVILQDMDHQEEDHQEEEDHLVHLEILAPWTKRTTRNTWT